MIVASCCHANFTIRLCDPSFGVLTAKSIAPATNVTCDGLIVIAVFSAIISKADGSIHPNCSPFLVFLASILTVHPF
ncbi:hypothetical protein GW750_07420 [bacterium]|nr:hypothetical protein [bacterium]